MTRRRGIRIGSGSLRGRTIDVPEGLAVRPMRSRVREAFFNHLGARVIGARFLDVFSGSGAIAIEAVSRGAAHAVLIERAPEVLRRLRSNLTNLDLGDRCRLLAVDVYQEPDFLPAEPFDVIFLDPPFGDFRAEGAGDPVSLLRRLAVSEALREGGIIGLERPTELDPTSDPPGTEVEFRRSYGDTTLELWERVSGAR